MYTTKKGKGFGGGGARGGGREEKKKKGSGAEAKNLKNHVVVLVKFPALPSFRFHRGDDCKRVSLAGRKRDNHHGKLVNSGATGVLAWAIHPSRSDDPLET